MTERNQTADKVGERLEIRYETSVGGKVESREIPFVVGVLGDFTGHPRTPALALKDRRFSVVTADNFDAVMKKKSPRLAFHVADKLTGGGDMVITVEVEFREFRDFEPEAVARQVAPLRSLLDIRRQLVNLRSRLYGNNKLEEVLFQYSHNQYALEKLRGELDISLDEDGVAVESQMLERILDEAGLARGPEDRWNGREWLRAYFQYVLSGDAPVSRDTEAVIETRIGEIDRIVSLQLNEVLHHPDFQQLEATWRGLHLLVTGTPSTPAVQVKILSVTKRELGKALSMAVDFDQSAIFRKVYEEEYGSFLGDPFAVLLGDYYFGCSPQDVNILEQMSRVAASSHAVFLAGVDPGMFHFDSFAELVNPRDLRRIFDNDAHLQWEYFRESDDSRHVGLVLPHMLLRTPYGASSDSGWYRARGAAHFGLEEDVDGSDHQKYLWGNAAYAFVLQLTTAFAAQGWCADILGVENGGLIRGLPVHTYYCEEGTAMKCPTEVPISDRRLTELTKLGFTGLCHAKGTGSAAFFWAPSCHKPKMLLDEDDNARERMSSRLDYVLAVSRFAHYLMAITREKAHSFRTREECRAYLEEWVRPYVASPAKGGETKEPWNLGGAPLAEATVEVEEIPGKSGVFAAALLLRPRLRFQEQPSRLVVPIELKV